MSGSSKSCEQGLIMRESKGDLRVIIKIIQQRELSRSKDLLYLRIDVGIRSIKSLYLYSLDKSILHELLQLTSWIYNVWT